MAKKDFKPFLHQKDECFFDENCVIKKCRKCNHKELWCKKHDKICEPKTCQKDRLIKNEQTDIYNED